MQMDQEQDQEIDAESETGNTLAAAGDEPVSAARPSASELLFAEAVADADRSGRSDMNAIELLTDFS